MPYILALAMPETDFEIAPTQRLLMQNAGCVVA